MKISDEAQPHEAEEVNEYAILFLDPKGQVANWNKEAERIKGYKAEEIIGKNFNLFYTKEDREKNLPEKLIQKAILYGKAAEEGWKIRKDGTRFLGNVLLTTVYDENNKVTGFSEITRDLSEGNGIEKTKKVFWQTKDGLMKLFNASPSGMALTDLVSRKFAEVNVNFLTTFEYTREETIGLSPDELGIVSVESRAELAAKLKEQGHLKNETAVCRSKSGRTIDCIVSGDMFEIGDKKYFLSVFHDVSERKALERKIAQSENNYRKIIEEAGDVLYTTDAMGLFTFVNKRAAVLTEYTPEELIGKHFSMLIAPAWQEKVGRHYMEQFKNKIPETVLEFIICTKSGIEKWAEQVVVMQVEANFVKGFHCIVRDIDDRKKANLLFREQEENIRKLAEFQNIILNGTEYSIITSSTDGIITSFNKGAEKMLGYKAEEVLGILTPEIIHDKAEVEKRAKELSEELNIKVEPGIDVFHIKARQEHIIETHEWTYICKNGNRIIVDLSITALRDKENNVIGYLGLAKDITLSKKAEMEMFQFKKFFDLTIDMVCIANTDGYFKKVSPSFIHVLGYTEKELMEKIIFTFIHPDDVPAAIQEMEKLQKGIVSVSFICRFICKDCSEKSLQWVAAPDPKTGNIFAIARDITLQQQTEKDLIQAKHAAEGSVILIETFLANMSHEIRTPMNAIIGFTDLLLKRNLPEQEKEYVQTVKSSGENLLRIINDILDISKIESGAMVFESHPINIKDFFVSLNNMLLQRAKEKGLYLSFECDLNLPVKLNADPTRLTQIILNLVGNAIKFTSKGGIEIFARLLKEEEETCEIEFSVKDSGIGIPEDKLHQIFERFRQAETHTTRYYGGTGLGLSIAKQLVELQGGEIAVKSTPGEGSVFSFWLRFQKTDAVPAVKQVSAKSINIHELGKYSILLVEDNPINVKFILSLFSEYSINTDVAENGKLAIEKMKNKKYDIVLMDIEMPVMNGYETTWAIRNELKNDVPIIAMTAHAMAGEKEKCLTKGMNNYISKPINTDVLFEKMHDALNGKVKNEKGPNVKRKITNLEYLLVSMNGKKELINEIIDIFLKQIPGDLTAITEALAKTDYLTIKQISHRIKSTISMMGISDMKKILDEMEVLATAENEIDKIKILNHSLDLLGKEAMHELELERRS